MTRIPRRLLASSLVSVMLLGACASPTPRQLHTTRIPTAPVKHCADPQEWTVARKIAGTLTVAVYHPEHARAIAVDSSTPVGGIFISSLTTGVFTQDHPLQAVRRDAEAAHGMPLEVSIDEEGGLVQRIAEVAGPMPSAAEMAATLTPEATRQWGEQRGAILAEYGITVDYAPVVDLGGNPAATVVGSRAFAPEPDTVITYAAAFAEGLAAAGVRPVLKHFPGHGNTVGDSHYQAVQTPPVEQLAPDLAPYRALERFPEADIMVGHLEVPGLSTPGEPATMDPQMYAFLRADAPEGLGFDGVIYTDDLSDMQAAAGHRSVPDAVVKALAAGADVPLFVNPAYLDAVIARGMAAVESGELTQSQLDRALQRRAMAKGCGRPLPR